MGTEGMGESRETETRKQKGSSEPGKVGRQSWGLKVSNLSKQQQQQQPDTMQNRRTVVNRARKVSASCSWP